MTYRNYLRDYVIGIGIGLAIIVILLSLESCGGAVLASGASTIITTPTQITTDQIGDYTIGCGGSLYGLPNASGRGVKITGNVTFSCASGFGLLQDVTVSGCVTVDRTARVEITRIWVQGCTQVAGVQFVSDPFNIPGGNQSCCSKLDHVISFNNTGSGFRADNTADLFISNSEFEANGRYGIELINSPTLRVDHSDIGGGALGGLFADPGSSLLILTGIQFGNNKGPDLLLQSDSNVMTGLSFIGPPGFCSIQSSSNQVFGANFYGPRPRC